MVVEIDYIQYYYISRNINAFKCKVNGERFRSITFIKFRFMKETPIDAHFMRTLYPAERIQYFNIIIGFKKMVRARQNWRTLKYDWRTNIGVFLHFTFYLFLHSKSYFLKILCSVYKKLNLGCKCWCKKMVKCWCKLHF